MVTRFLRQWLKQSSGVSSMTEVEDIENYLFDMADGYKPGDYTDDDSIIAAAHAYAAWRKLRERLRI